MKLIPKLTFSYVVTVLLCIMIVGGFYYFRLESSIRNQTTELLGNTMAQACKNIEYKVELYNSMAEQLYMNQKLQELLFREYYDVISRSKALDDIAKFIEPLADGYKDIDELSIYLRNKTITPYEDYLLNIESLNQKEIRDSLSERNDHARWLIYKEIIPPVQVPIDNNGFWVDEEAAEQETMETRLVLTKNMRYLRTADYLGVLVVKFNRNRVFSGIADQKDKDGGWFDVTDPEGNLIYSGSEAYELEENFDNTDARQVQSNYRAFTQETGKRFTLNLNHNTYVILKETIEATGWSLFYVNSLDIYRSNLSELQIVTIILIALCLIIFVLLSWLMAIRFSKRIRILSHSMREIQTGNFNIQIQAEEGDEIDDLGRGFNRMARELKKLVEEVMTIKEREKEAELKALQAQINPHFLYNTLASISYLGVEYGAHEVTRMSNSLAKFYRLSLSKGKSIISIRDEVEHIKAYVDIQNVRFKDRIHVWYEVEEEVLEACSPKLLLQPFVENAIVHGMWINKKHINIRIIIRREKERIVWKVIDDGIGIPVGKVSGQFREKGMGTSNYGIGNVDARIKILYGEEHGVKIFSRPGIGTEVTMTTAFQTPDP